MKKIESKQLAKKFFKLGQKDSKNGRRNGYKIEDSSAKKWYFYGWATTETKKESKSKSDLAFSDGFKAAKIGTGKIEAPTIYNSETDSFENCPDWVEAWNIVEEIKKLIEATSYSEEKKKEIASLGYFCKLRILVKNLEEAEEVGKKQRGIK